MTIVLNVVIKWKVQHFCHVSLLLSDSKSIYFDCTDICQKHICFRLQHNPRSKKLFFFFCKVLKTSFTIFSSCCQEHLLSWFVKKDQVSPRHIIIWQKCAQDATRGNPIHHRGIILCIPGCCRTKTERMSKQTASVSQNIRAASICIHVDIYWHCCSFIFVLIEVLS